MGTPSRRAQATLIGMRILDSHIHFWQIGGPGQTWPDADWPTLHRDFGAENLTAAVDGLDWVGGVLVQSQPDDRDTDWMIATASDDPAIRAIVGWVDFAHPDAPARIASLAAAPKLRGLRPMLQGIADTDWILREDLTPAIRAMLDHGLSFDALVEPRHLGVLATFARRWPNLPIVIDHAAKPFAARGELDPWRDDLAAVAACANVWCKLSGLRTEQAPGQPARDLRGYVDHLVAQFTDRLMWGSDWPVLLHAGDTYADWVDATLGLLAPTSTARISDIFEAAALRFYQMRD